jgi:hypothetical protein
LIQAHNFHLSFLVFSGMQDNRKDLSHPVHSDNCVLDEAMGECHKVPPAYTWRDYRYVAMIVLINNIIAGGLHVYFVTAQCHPLPEQ